MVTTSALLAAFTVALCLLCAAASRHFGRLHGEPAGKVRALTWGSLLAAPLCGGFVYSVDAGQRRVTLHEVVLESRPEPGALRRHELLIDVEHPGVEHVLRVTPIPARMGSAGGPCAVGVQWTDPAGSALVHAVSEAPTRYSSRHAVRSVWDGVSWRFVPGTGGQHRLVIEIAHPDVAELLVRVEDPRKRDGVRARGY